MQKLLEGSSSQTRKTKQKKTNKTAAKSARSNRGQGVPAMTNKERPAGKIQNHPLVVLGRLPDSTAWARLQGNADRFTALPTFVWWTGKAVSLVISQQ